jgi:predicted dithiol-disulfide oxidoreductase (DUF899 family)
MTGHTTGTREDWLTARRALLTAEKEHFRRGDELARVRAELPWVALDKEYGFDTDEGRKTLAELFDGRSQLLVYHFMFGVGFRLTDERQGCTGCSFVADHFDAVIPHLNGHDVTLVCASLAPLDQLQDYRRQLGWRFPWVSSLGSDFNYDFGVAFTEEQQQNGAEYNFRHVDRVEPQREGMSAFALQDGLVHHTYSTYNRGVEALMGTYQFLDRAPLGRNEDGLEYGQAWWRRHDEYVTS